MKIQTAWWYLWLHLLVTSQVQNCLNSSAGFHSCSCGGRPKIHLRKITLISQAIHIWLRTNEEMEMIYILHVNYDNSKNKRNQQSLVPWSFYMMFEQHVQLCAPHVVLHSGDSGSTSHTPVGQKNQKEQESWSVICIKIIHFCNSSRTDSINDSIR